MKHFFYYFQIVLMFCSCGPNIPREVRNALDAKGYDNTFFTYENGRQLLCNHCNYLDSTGQKSTLAIRIISQGTKTKHGLDHHNFSHLVFPDKRIAI